MATVVLKNLGTDTIPIMDFGCYGGSLSWLSEDVFDYWACDADVIADDPSMDEEDKAEALQLIAEKYDGHEIFDAQVVSVAPGYLQQALDEYGIAARIIPDSCEWYHPREYNFVDDSMCFDMEVDTDWVADTFMELSQNPEFQQCVKKHFSSRSGFISFIPDNVAELEELLDPSNKDYWKAVAAIVRYFVDQDPQIAVETTDEMVEYISGNANFVTFSALGI